MRRGSALLASLNGRLLGAPMSSRSPDDDAPVIDVHAHAVLEVSLGAAGAAGPEIGADERGRPWYRVGDYVLHGVRYRGGPFMDVALRLEAMEQAGIDR